LSEARLINLKMSGRGEGKARVPTFDDKLESYEEFEIQWNAFVQVEGFSDALMAKGHPDMPPDHTTAIPDDGQGQGKKQARAKKENAKAVAYYTLAFKSARLRAIINKANTNEWPGGEAWMINPALVNTYRPDDIIAAAEARRRLNAVSMKKHKFPAITIGRNRSCLCRHNHKIYSTGLYWSCVCNSFRKVSFSIDFRTAHQGC
jgi:hypothetical protein